jgi:hypothetical protein
MGCEGRALVLRRGRLTLPHRRLCALGDQTMSVGFYNDGAQKGIVVDLSNRSGI